MKVSERSTTEVTLQDFVDAADSNANWNVDEGSPSAAHWTQALHHLKKAKLHAALAEASEDLSQDEYMETVSHVDGVETELDPEPVEDVPL